MSAEHTPGPWEYFDHPAYTNVFTVGPREFKTVAEVRAGNEEDGLPEQTEANARLIAAAPDLLAALLAILQAHEITSDHFEEVEVDGEMVRPGAISELARAAIAKAKGGAA